MFIVLGIDGKEYGPASAMQIQAWKRDGRVNDATLLRRPGEADWQPLEDFPEFQPTPPPIPSGALPPPVPVQSAGDAGKKRSSTRLDVIGCYERSWKLFWKKPGTLLGACAVTGALQLVASLVPALSLIYGFVIAGVILGGLQLVFVRRIRDEEVRVGQLFDGFRQRPAQLILATMVRSVFEVGALLPVVLLMQGTATPWWLIALSVLAGIYLTLAYTFAFVLILDRHLGFWEGLETSRRLAMAQPFRILLLGIVGLSLLILGLLCLGVGVFIAAPVVVGAYAFAYVDLTSRHE